MTNETIELARRAVACEGWWWMEGMAGLVRTDDGGWMRVRVLSVDESGTPDRWHIEEWERRKTHHGTVSGYGSPAWCFEVWEEAMPVFDDLATLGCMLALVREAYDDPSALVAALEGAK